MLRSRLPIPIDFERTIVRRVHAFFGARRAVLFFVEIMISGNDPKFDLAIKFAISTFMEQPREKRQSSSLTNEFVD